MLLLPPADVSHEMQTRSIQRINEAIDFDITLWTIEKELIGTTNNIKTSPEENINPGTWVPSNNEKRWTTVLPDGRWIMIDIGNLKSIDDPFVVIFSLLILAFFIALSCYPFIRHLTKRLENLQLQVERIGSGYLGARVDIYGCDEIAELAISFNKAAEQIENLVTAQRMLLANASHELRTPLTRIRLGIEMLKNSEGEHNETKQVLDKDIRLALEKDIEELNLLIDELILMTRLDTDTSMETFQKIDLVALVAEECSRYKGISVRNTSFNNEPTEIRGDRRMLQHLLRNLLDNANIHGLPPVEVVIIKERDKIKLKVEDAGKGIQDSEKKNVFQPFYRAADKQNVPGYGLGLPLARKIAEAHDAVITIENKPKSSINLNFPTIDLSNDKGSGISSKPSLAISKSVLETSRHYFSLEIN